MFTKPITFSSFAVSEISNDMSSIRRLVTVAAINPRFCSQLLQDPASAVLKGFGGERFHVSDLALSLIGSVQASTLPEFIHLLDQSFSDHLQSHDRAQAVL
jgi:hypothetical protein